MTVQIPTTIEDFIIDMTTGLQIAFYKAWREQNCVGADEVCAAIIKMSTQDIFSVCGFVVDGLADIYDLKFEAEPALEENVN